MHQPLKIISLNTWGGRAGKEKLLSFFKDHQDIDVFCLQEMWDGGEHTAGHIAAGRDMKGVDFHLVPHVSNLLTQHTVHFYPYYFNFFGVALIFRKTFCLIDSGSTYIYREEGYVSPTDIADHARVLHYITLETDQGLMTVLNLHGAWQPGGKTDTPERLDQSQRIVDFTNRFSHPLILAGDFNLTLNTRSVQLIEEAGWENLIRTHGITSTRTSHYDKPEKFADYVFVKNGVNVQEFRVLPEQISDHAPLFLSYTLPTKDSPFTIL